MTGFTNTLTSIIKVTSDTLSFAGIVVTFGCSLKLT